MPLAGRLAFPAPPAQGQRFPVVLWSSPYAGSLDAQVDENQRLQGRDPVVPVQTLLDAGYAVGGFHSRGTGDSGGCFDMFRAAEQSDQRVLLDWIARQPWSDGNIAVFGHSSDAISALWAAVSEHPALKTVVVSGIVTDIYTAVFSLRAPSSTTRCGAPSPPSSPCSPRRRPGRSSIPHPRRASSTRTSCSPVTWGTSARVCRPRAGRGRHRDRRRHLRPGVVRYVEERSAAWYEERRLLPHLGRVQAPVLLAHGFEVASEA